MRDIAGPGGHALTEALADWLSRHYSFVSDALYAGTAQRLGHTGKGAEDVAAVLRELGADALISGSVSDGIVYLVVRDAATGVVAATVQAEVGEPPARSSLQQIEQQLSQALDNIPSRSGSAGGGSGAPTPPAGEPGSPAAEAEAPEGSPAAGGGEAPSISATATPAGEEQGRSGVFAEQAAVSVAAGVASTLQSIALAHSPLGYQSGPTLGARVELAFLPFALAQGADHPAFLDHVGVYAEDEYDPPVNATVQAAPGAASVQVHEQRWSLGARGRVFLGPALWLADIGYGERLLSAPPTAIAGAIPSLTYHLLLVRAGSLVPLGAHLAFVASAALLAAPTADTLPASRFSGGTAAGTELRAGLEIPFGSLYLAGTLSASWIDLSVNDAALGGLETANDTSFGGSAVLGYRY